MERDQNGSNEDRNDDVEPYASENEGDYGDDPEETDDESLIDGEAEEGEGFGAREEEEEPSDEGEEEDNKGESDGLGVGIGVVSCRFLAEAAQMGREREIW